MELDKGLYVFPWQSMAENNCNSYFIDGDVPTLIDPGHRHLFPHLINALALDGIDPERIRLVINTHAHPDHFEASEHFYKTGARITMSLEEKRFLDEAGSLFFSSSQKRKPDFTMDLLLQEGKLNLGSIELEILLTPGHSPGSLCVYWPERKALFSGDLVFVGGIGRTDIPGGDSGLLAASIKRVSELEIEFLLPGHGTILKGIEHSKKNFQYINHAFIPYL